MKLLYHGPLWKGGTALQRAEAFARVRGVEVMQLDTTYGVRDQHSSLYARGLWKIGFPLDTLQENSRLLDVVEREKPDVVLADNSKVLRRRVLSRIKALGSLLVYYTPDDVMATHNLKMPLRRSFPLWDIFFTTKTYNVPELAAAGVKRPILMGKSFDPTIHHPMIPAQVGVEFEKFDVVFIGTFEPERCASLNRLAEAGISVLIHGAKAGMIAGDWRNALHPSIELRGPVFADEYRRAMHHGKIALCFLRKMNRDRITQRSIELPAMARPMLAEKTDEHDAHFIEGVEYVSFVSDSKLVAGAKALLAHPDCRTSVAAAGRRRCLESGYSTEGRAEQMVSIMREVLHGASGRRSGETVAK